MRRLFLGLILFAVLAWLAYHWSQRTVPATPRAVSTDSLGGGMRTMRLFFASPDADSLIVETREIAEPSGPHATVAALVAELDRGPRERGVAVLPAGTSVLDVFAGDRGQLTVDLSRAFLQGFHGGSSAEYLAVATLVRTLGANMPDVRTVQIVCGGTPIVTLGGHVPLDRPLVIGEWSASEVR